MSDSHDSRPGPFGELPGELPENLPTLETILSHVSVRRFRDEALPDRQIALLHEAIRRAPSSSAMQSVMYVTVTDKQVLAELRPHVGGQAFIEQCGAFIVGCMDLRYLDRVVASRPYANRSSDFRKFVTSLEDISISLQNASLAAESMGLGTVMVGGTIDGSGRVAHILGLPTRVVPMLSLAVGVPDEPASPVRPRLPRPLLFHRDRYDGDIETEQALLDEHDRELVERGYYDGRPIKWSDIGMTGADAVKPEQYGWQEHAARKQARVWWESASPRLVRNLKELGWNPIDLLSLWDSAD